jgi:hypothetical protein
MSPLDFGVLVAADAPILSLFLCVLCVLARECSFFRAPTALPMRSGRERDTNLNQWLIVWVHGEAHAARSPFSRHPRVLLSGIQVFRRRKKLDSRQEHAGMTVGEHAGMTAAERAGMTAGERGNVPRNPRCNPSCYRGAGFKARVHKGR